MFLNRQSLQLLRTRPYVDPLYEYSHPLVLILLAKIIFSLVIVRAKDVKKSNTNQECGKIATGSDSLDELMNYIQNFSGLLHRFSMSFLFQKEHFNLQAFLARAMESKEAKTVLDNLNQLQGSLDDEEMRMLSVAVLLGLSTTISKSVFQARYPSGNEDSLALECLYEDYLFWQWLQMESLLEIQGLSQPNVLQHFLGSCHLTPSSSESQVKFFIIIWVQNTFNFLLLQVESLFRLMIWGYNLNGQCTASTRDNFVFLPISFPLQRCLPEVYLSSECG